MDFSDYLPFDILWDAIVLKFQNGKLCRFGCPKEEDIEHTLECSSNGMATKECSKDDIKALKKEIPPWNSGDIVNNLLKILREKEETFKEEVHEPGKKVMHTKTINNKSKLTHTEITNIEGDCQNVTEGINRNESQIIAKVKGPKPWVYSQVSSIKTLSL